MQIYKKILEQKYDESHYFYNKVLNKNLSEKFFAPLPSPTVNLSLTAPEAEHSERCHCKANAHTAVKYDYLGNYTQTFLPRNTIAGFSGLSKISKVKKVNEKLKAEKKWKAKSSFWKLKIYRSIIKKWWFCSG